MTFLEICQELARLASIPGGGPTAVTGQTGELLRVVNWAKQAWLDIEIRHPRWNFLRKDLQFNTVIGQQAYTMTQMAALDLRMVDRDSLRTYETAVGVNDEQYIVFWDYNIFRDTYMYAQQTQQRPTVFTSDPANKNLLFGSIPDKIYTVRGKYWRRAVAPTTDAEVPAFPDEYHQLVVYRALMKYAGYEAAGDAKQTALEEYGPLMRALERDQLPQLQFGEPMA